jgi:hypothetical protein
MTTAITISEQEMNAPVSGELTEPSGTTLEEISEAEENLPEETERPNKETSDLIAVVIRVADEFRPCHTKLGIIIDEHRAKIVALKRKFGVHRGSRGHRLLIPKDGKNVPLYWDDFVVFHFGVTSRRLNQLLEVKDDQELGITRFKRPDVEKPLYKRGFEAGKKAHHQPTDTTYWTDNVYIKACVEFIGSRLQPLESDPNRFATVATAIAQEILGRVGKWDDGAHFTNEEPNQKAVSVQ